MTKTEGGAKSLKPAPGQLSLNGTALGDDSDSEADFQDEGSFTTEGAQLQEGFDDSSKLVGVPNHEELKQDLRSELAEKKPIIDGLHEELESAIAQKDSAEQALAEYKVRHKTETSYKNTEAKQLKDEVEDYKLRLSSLEKASISEKEGYKAKIKLLEEELRNEDTTQHTLERITNNREGLLAICLLKSRT